MIIKTLKKYAHKVFNLFGFDIMKRSHFDTGLADHLKTVLKNRKIDCVLDVGANIGQYGNFLRNIGFNGYIVSFEPIQSVYDELCRQSVHDPKWLCYNLALSDQAQSKEINIYPDTQFSSFLDASDYSKKTWHELNIVSTEMVNLVRLDDVLDEIKNQTACQNFYLKMDTQGFDLNIFRGALESLRDIKAIQSEIALIYVYNNMDDSYDVLKEYHKNGFFISNMSVINREKSLAVIEYDCVLVRRSDENNEF